MTASSELADRIARRFESRWVRGYVRGKLNGDPAYAAALGILSLNRLPILDVGCGLGLLSFYLREHGFEQPMMGIDIDERKIKRAREVSNLNSSNIDFEVRDARSFPRFSGNVVMLDLLHYFTDGDQRLILDQAVESVAPGGFVVIRECLRDSSWRYPLTYAEELLATSLGWLRGERLNFPTKGQIALPFRERGFVEQIRPLWGRTPFNNYCLVFGRP